ncbi:MAG: GNAT family N-acetyltransferase [Chitinivibrionales bacterium]|nr:GNAT family N-acetyltransferase [Chitinivibrionales bacterium]
MYCDMLVKLYELHEDNTALQQLEQRGIEIKRALAPDKGRVIEYIRRHHTENGYESEADVAFSNKPVSCFIAVKDRRLVGFACYEVTAKDFFGPIAVESEYRGIGVGTALLLKCLIAMREDGYAYAIIGWVGEAKEFFAKTVKAIPIENSFPGVYARMIDCKSYQSDESL